MRFPRNSRFKPSVLCLLVLAGWMPTLVAAGDDPARLCDLATVRVTQNTDVPLDVLRAISQAETGEGLPDGLGPWPWTVNIQGQAVWFDRPDQARAHVFRHFMAVTRSFAIGCFQINYKRHSHDFNSIDEMFDPLLNAEHAARVLKELYAESGDWAKAVEAYQAAMHQYARGNALQYPPVEEPQRRISFARATQRQAGASGLIVPAPHRRETERRGSPASLFVSGLGG